MENKLAKLTAAYFDSIEFKYDIGGDNKEVIETGMGGLDNITSVRLLLFFDENERSAQVLAPQIVKVPENKREQLYKVINDINQRFRWTKFYLDSDGDVMVSADCILDAETCGQEIFEIMQRTIRIADTAYPDLMKEIWK